MKHIYPIILLLVAVVASPIEANAGKADVVKVKITKSSSRSFHLDVTVKHGDTGWDHYANKWEVVGPDGTVLGTRVLYHPHVDEQPFTRSLSGVKIPKDAKTVSVRAYDLVHGAGGKEITVNVPR